MTDLAMWLQVGAGLFLTGFGIAVLWRGRRASHARRLRPGERPRLADGDESHRMSLPTRQAVGLLLVVAGFHVAVWAIPPEVMPLQLPRRWWWAWGALGAALILASLGLDRLERSRLTDSPDRD